MQQTKELIESYIAAMGKQDWDFVSSVYDDDVVIDWPQSRERVHSKEQCLRVFQNYPGGSPSISPRKITGSGNVWVIEGDMDYSGKPWYGVMILEFRDGKVVHEADYFAEPFEAPAWRADWVERVGELAKT